MSQCKATIIDQRWDNERSGKKKKLIEIQWICKKLYKNIYNTYILTIYKILHVFITFLYKLFQDTQTALVKRKSLTERL